MADEDNIVTHQLLGRDMQIRSMSPGQLVLITRMAKRAQQQSERGDTTVAFNELMVKMMDLIDSLFVSEQDRQDVEDAMLTGKVSLEEIQKVAFGARAAAPDDDADPVAPKTLRGKKPAAVAKVAKKTANPRRAAR